MRKPALIMATFAVVCVGKATANTIFGVNKLFILEVRAINGLV